MTHRPIITGPICTIIRSTNLFVSLKLFNSFSSLSLLIIVRFCLLSREIPVIGGAFDTLRADVSRIIGEKVECRLFFFLGRLMNFGKLETINVTARFARLHSAAEARICRFYLLRLANFYSCRRKNVTIAFIIDRANGQG